METKRSHIKPLKYKKNDGYENLVIVHKYIHILIHATKEETIKQYLQLVGKENINIKKLNKLRSAVGNEVLTLLPMGINAERYRTC